MPRLSHDIPGWAAQYVGLEFKDRGRDRGGVDCWGLYRLAQAERYGVLLPSLLYESVGDKAGASAAVVQQRDESRDWAPIAVDQIRLGDAVLFRPGRNWHVGLMVAIGRMLHAQEGTQSCIERIDAPAWAPRLEGFFRFDGPVRIAGRPRPFSPSSIDTALPAGLSIEEMLAAAGVAPFAELQIFLGDRRVPRELWATTRPKPGRTLTVAAIPTGGQGGKSPARVILTIAVIAAAAYVTAGIAGYAALSVAQGGLGYSAATAGLIGGLAGAGVTIAGTLLVNAIVPPPRQKFFDDEKNSPSVTGSRNEMRPYGVVPAIHGEHRMAPLLAAAPYTEIVGEDQYLRQLFLWGKGPVEITDLKIADTPLSEYDGVEYEIREGRPDDAPCTIYSNSVFEESFSTLVDGASGWVSRTSGVDAEELSIDFTFPQGLVTIGADGGRQLTTVAVDVEYSPAGANAWVAINASSPDFSRGLAFMFRLPEVRFGGGGNPTNYHVGDVAWGLAFPQPKPGYLPATRYSWEATGYIYIDAPGTVTFGIDGSDAVELSIGGAVVVAWYGSHGTVGGAPDYTAHTGTRVFGHRGWFPITIRMECRTTTGAVAVGWSRPWSPAWVTIDDQFLAPQAGGQLAGRLRYRWFDTSSYNHSLIVQDAAARQLRRNIAWAVTKGQYDVRVRRTTPDSTDPQVFDKVYWTAMRTVRNENPVKEPNCALLALRIKATDQLQGVVDQLNGLVRKICPDWDPDTQSWIERATSNPASCLRDALQGTSNARPMADARLNITELQAFHEETTDRGLFCNVIFDTAGTLYERLAVIAATGRATPGMLDGLHTVVRDYKQDVPVQHFTPRNSFGYKGRKAFPDLPHGFRVQFLNKDAGYQRDERIVLDDGYQLDGKDAFGHAAPTLPEATNFEVLELTGVTSPEEAFKHGRYFIAVARLRPEVHEIGVDFEHLICTRGDLVLLSHDVPLLGSGSGRIHALILDTGNRLLGLELDDVVVMEAGIEYVIRVRLQDGSSFLRNVVNVPGESRQVTLAVPIPASDDIHPVSFVSKSGFLAGPCSAGDHFHQCIDENVPDDTDYVAFSGNSTLEVKLTAILDPGTDDGVEIFYRFNQAFGSAGQSLRADLYQGAALIASTGNQQNYGAAAHTFSKILTNAEAAAITDWADLRLRFVSTGSVSQTLALTWARLSVPGAARPKPGDLYMFGELSKETREVVVKGIEIDQDLSARLSLVDAAPGVHAASDGPIPPFDPGITHPPDYRNRPDTPVIESIRSDDFVMIRGADGTLIPRMLITLRRPSGTHPIPNAAQVLTRARPPAPAEPIGPYTYHPLIPIQDNQVSVVPVEVGVTYQIRLRTVTPTGLVSLWVVAEHTVLGKNAPPPDVAAFNVVRLSDGTRQYSWDLGTVPPDIEGVHIRYGPPGYPWNLMTPLHVGALQSTPAELNEPPEGVWRFGIKAVDTSGNESVDALYIDRALGPPRLENVAFENDEGFEGWPGARTHCHLAEDGSLEADDRATWGTLAALGAATWAQWTRWVWNPWSPISYESQVLDAGFVFEWSPEALAEGDGSLLTEVAWSTNGVTYTPWAEISSVRGTIISGRFLKARVTCSSNGVDPVAVIRRLLVIMRAPPVIFDIQDLDTSLLTVPRLIDVGDVRLPVPAARFAVVRHIDLTFNGMGPGWSWELVDKDPDLGPRVRLYNAQHQRSHATIDAVIRGIAPSSAPPAALYEDGFAGAPSGTPQYPSMFDIYPVRPPWHVAGVDYYVGIEAGVVLTPWYDLSPGDLGGLIAAIDPVGGQVDVAGTGTVEGIDFTLTAPGGAVGASVHLPTVGSNLTFRNCKIGLSNPGFNWSLIATTSPQTLTITRCLFDGGTIDESSFIGFGTGTLSITYCRCTNGNQHVVELGGAGTLVYIFQFNLVDQMNIGAGQHFNAAQWNPGTIAPSPLIRFNTYYGNGTGNGELFQFTDAFSNPITLTAPECSNNVMIARGGVHLMGNFLHGGLATGGEANDNYVDASGADGGLFYPGTMLPGNGWACSGNINLLDGSTVTPA